MAGKKIEVIEVLVVVMAMVLLFSTSAAENNQQPDTFFSCWVLCAKRCGYELICDIRCIKKCKHGDQPEQSTVSPTAAPPLAFHRRFLGGAGGARD